MFVTDEHRLRGLGDLYQEMHDVAVRRDRGRPPLVRRPVEPRVLESRLLLLAQGLALGTQRVTGYPYRRPEGLSDAGRRLDDFLAPLGHTIDHTCHARRYAYSTDLIPWFPGKSEDGRHDIPATSAEVAECWHWLERQITLVQPDAIVLLGRDATRAFLPRHAGIEARRTSPSLLQLAERPYPVRFDGRQLLAVVAWHPSSAWGKFATSARATYERAQVLLSRALA